MDVSILGLGTMGAAMARRLLGAGHALTVWNRSLDKATPLAQAGARVAGTPAEAARSAEVVIAMLADPPAVEAVLLGSGGAIEGLAPGAIVVDCSTVTPALARRVDEAARAKGGLFLDAPVSGTRAPAEEGRLLVMVGGPAEALALARPVLEAFGAVRHVGGVGQGMAMKLVLNGLGAHMITGLAAMLGLGRHLGLEVATMLDVIGAGAFASPLYATKGRRIAAGDFSPDFALDLYVKDQRLVLETADALDLRFPSQEAIYGVAEAAQRTGLGAEDYAALAKLYRP